MSDIAEAAAQHPFVVVVGEGGCGKTVTVCDAAIDNLSTVGVPPGFAMVVKAHKLNRCSIQDTVRRWVNQLENPDMFAMDQTLARLEKAIPLFPVLTLYIDGVDERHGWQDLSTEARDFLCELIYSAQDSVRNGMPRFSVVVTCRHERELQGIGGGGFPLAAMPVSYSVSEFKLGDLAELAKKLGGCPRVGRRINDHISTRQGISYAAPSIEAPVDPERIEIIRHPVFWRCFEGLSDLQKHCFLDGIPDSLEEIATSYINWFFRKVSARVGDLQLNAAQTAMRYAATRFVSNDPFREADLREDWLGPCESAQCPSTHRMPIFQEAVSAGLIESEGSKEKWRWKRPWLCEYFAKEEGINV